MLPFQTREGRRGESEPGFQATLLQLLNREMKLSACTPAGFNYSLNQRNIKSNISFDIKYNDELHESSFCACLPQEHLQDIYHQDIYQAGRHVSGRAAWPMSNITMGLFTCTAEHKAGVRCSHVKTRFLLAE